MNAGKIDLGKKSRDLPSVAHIASSVTLMVQMCLSLPSVLQLHTIPTHKRAYIYSICVQTYTLARSHFPLISRSPYPPYPPSHRVCVR